MPLSASDLLYGFVIPALVGGIIWFVLQRVVKVEVIRRFAATTALFAGFGIGYWLLAMGPWQPKTHWQWLPYGLLIAVAVTPSACAPGVSWIERMMLYLLAAGSAGWLLVPAWEDLDPSRTTYLVCWTALVVLVATVIEPLTRRLHDPELPFVLTMALLSATAVLALSGSLRFAQMAGAGAGAMLGMTLAAWHNKSERPFHGIGLAFAMLSSGLMLVGQVHSFTAIPLVSYLLIPLSPMLLWGAEFGPLRQLSGWKRSLAQVSLPLAVVAVAVVLAVAVELRPADS